MRSPEAWTRKRMGETHATQRSRTTGATGARKSDAATTGRYAAPHARARSDGESGVLLPCPSRSSSPRQDAKTRDGGRVKTTVLARSLARWRCHRARARAILRGYVPVHHPDWTLLRGEGRVPAISVRRADHKHELSSLPVAGDIPHIPPSAYTAVKAYR
eukprot:4065376-Pleurochrysis_carterae.AAC.2